MRWEDSFAKVQSGKFFLTQHREPQPPHTPPIEEYFFCDERHFIHCRMDPALDRPISVKPITIGEASEYFKTLVDYSYLSNWRGVPEGSLQPIKVLPRRILTVSRTRMEAVVQMINSLGEGEVIGPVFGCGLFFYRGENGEYLLVFQNSSTGEIPMGWSLPLPMAEDLADYLLYLSPDAVELPAKLDPTLLENGKKLLNLPRTYFPIIDLQDYQPRLEIKIGEWERHPPYSDEENLNKKKERIFFFKDGTLYQHLFYRQPFYPRAFINWVKLIRDVDWREGPTPLFVAAPYFPTKNFSREILALAFESYEKLASGNYGLYHKRDEIHYFFCWHPQWGGLSIGFQKEGKITAIAEFSLATIANNLDYYQQEKKPLKLQPLPEWIAQTLTTLAADLLPVAEKVLTALTQDEKSWLPLRLTFGSGDKYFLLFRNGPGWIKATETLECRWHDNDENYEVLKFQEELYPQQPLFLAIMTLMNGGGREQIVKIPRSYLTEFERREQNILRIQKLEKLKGGTKASRLSAKTISLPLWRLQNPVIPAYLYFYPPRGWLEIRLNPTKTAIESVKLMNEWEMKYSSTQGKEEAVPDEIFGQLEPFLVARQKDRDQQSQFFKSLGLADFAFQFFQKSTQFQTQFDREFPNLSGSPGYYFFYQSTFIGAFFSQEKLNRLVELPAGEFRGHLKKLPFEKLGGTWAEDYYLPGFGFFTPAGGIENIPPLCERQILAHRQRRESIIAALHSSPTSTILKLRTGEFLTLTSTYGPVEFQINGDNIKIAQFHTQESFYQTLDQLIISGIPEEIFPFPEKFLELTEQSLRLEAQKIHSFQISPQFFILQQSGGETGSLTFWDGWYLFFNQNSKGEILHLTPLPAEEFGILYRTLLNFSASSNSIQPLFDICEEQQFQRHYRQGQLTGIFQHNPAKGSAVEQFISTTFSSPIKVDSPPKIPPGKLFSPYLPPPDNKVASPIFKADGDYFYLGKSLTRPGINLPHSPKGHQKIFRWGNNPPGQYSFIVELDNNLIFFSYYLVEDKLILHFSMNKEFFNHSLRQFSIDAHNFKGGTRLCLLPFGFLEEAKPSLCPPWLWKKLQERVKGGGKFATSFGEGAILIQGHEQSHYLFNPWCGLLKIQRKSAEKGERGVGLKKGTPLIEIQFLHRREELPDFYLGEGEPFFAGYWWAQLRYYPLLDPHQPITRLHREYGEIFSLEKGDGPNKLIFNSRILQDSSLCFTRYQESGYPLSLVLHDGKIQREEWVKKTGSATDYKRAVSSLGLGATSAILKGWGVEWR